jgi:GNAT superfamily N-acetyltransferase
MALEIKILQRGDEDVLANVLPDVFDNPVNEKLSSEFLSDSRHHLAVAIDVGRVVGFASAVDYIHPDKSQDLWINEVRVSATYRKRGLPKQILGTLLKVGRQLGCREVWVLTDRPNSAAMRVYESLGGKGTDHVMFTIKL